MLEWLAEISETNQEREEALLPLAELSEEIHQAALETEMLLQATNEIQSALASIVGKIEHAN